MSREEFDENKQVILAGLNALMKNPKSRNRFRILAVYEESPGDPGELLVQVFPTPHGPVVVHCSYGRVSRVGNAMFVRQRANLDDSIVAPLTGDPDQRFRVVSKSSADLSISGRDLMQWLAEGKTRHAISQPSEFHRPLSQTAQLALWLADNVDAIAANPRAGEFHREIKQMMDDIVRVLNQD